MMNVNKMDLAIAMKTIAEEMSKASPKESVNKIEAKDLIQVYKDARKIADWCDKLIDELVANDGEVLWPVYPKK